MSQLTLDITPTEPCCAKPNIAKLAFRAPDVNNICLSCREHWYGTEQDVTRYSRKQWDALMETAI